MRRPPLALAVATLAAGWGAAYSAGRWVYGFVTYPVHEDVRYDYVAAQAGLRFGWSHIYDWDVLRGLSAHFAESSIGTGGTYVSPPLLAWLFVPLVGFPEPVAYLVWTLLSLAALVWMWHVAAPFRGLRRIALLLLAAALWPVLQAFFYGQPAIPLLAAVATSWWLLSRDRVVLAGLALAFATFLKPQVVFLIPVCLLASRRFAPVLSWAGACVALAAVSALSLGQSGLEAYWKTLTQVQQDASHSYFTIAYLLGPGPLAYAVLGLQAAACAWISWRRRDELEVVFALGLLGSLMASIHLHDTDYTNVVLAAWLVRRRSASVAHMAWLGLGVVTMQLVTLGLPGPQLLWDAGWLVFIAFDRRLPAVPGWLRPPGEQHALPAVRDGMIPVQAMDEGATTC